MNDKQRIKNAYEHLNERMVLELNFPSLNFEFIEEDTTIASKLIASENKLVVNLTPIMKNFERIGMSYEKKNIESVVGWLLGREHYFLKKNQDHQTDFSKIGAANAEVFRRGYEGEGR